MTAFADFIRNYPDPLSESSEKFEPVKVALIDDGVDSTFKGLNERIARGQSYSRRGSDLCNPYYLSTCGHGTVMACLICQMCPKVKLYVAKLDEEETDSGRSITTSSAAKVCPRSLQVNFEKLILHGSILRVLRPSTGHGKWVYISFP